MFPDAARTALGPARANYKVSADIHVLVVEDEALIAMDIESYLNDLGFVNISVAASLPSALNSVRAKRPDLAILDVNLGQTLVFPVAAELRRLGVPFFFSTGRHISELPAEWTSERIVPKPANKKAIAAAVEKLGFRLH